MKFLIILGLSLLGHSTFAQNTEILNCKYKDADWQSELSLDAVGNASFKFKNKTDKEFFKCKAEAETLANSRHSQAPHYRAHFSLKSCEPSVNLENKKVLKELLLIVYLDRKAPDVTKGSVFQWLSYKQPEACKIEVFKYSDLERAAELLPQKLWGPNRKAKALDVKDEKK